ncbi:MAG: hypothetical protein GY722_21490 [bacterium]|nr:hypothetical protein [bacterium]
MSSDRPYPTESSGLRMADPPEPRLHPGEGFDEALQRLARGLVQAEIDRWQGDREAAAQALQISIERLTGLLE